MDGISIKSAQQFLQSGGLGSDQSLKIDQSQVSPLGGGADATPTGLNFAETLKTAIDKVNELQKAADKGMQDLATGRTDNVADVMIASEKADIALRVMVQVRNKVIDAYNEIMKMQV